MSKKRPEQKEPPGNPGRPRGTTRSREGHRRRLDLRLSPEAHQMIQEGLHSLPPSSTKTEFVEQAIIHYYQTLTQSSSVDQAGQVLAHGNGGHKAEGENSVHVPGPHLPHMVTPAMQKNEIQQDLVRTEHAEDADIEQRDHIDEVLQAWKHVLPEQDHLLPEQSFLAVIDIFGRLERVVKLLEADFAHLAGHYNITASELFLVMALGRTVPSYSLAPRELVKSLLVTPGTITKQVDRLTALKVVERQLGTEDRRSILIKLTPAGHQLFHTIIASDSSYRDCFQALLQMSWQEQKELSKILRNLTLALERKGP